MKANELRIGNWVNVTDKDYQVTQILERGVNCGHIGAMYDLVKPIPLTDEWLLKFGYTNTNEEYLTGTLWRKGDDVHLPILIDKRGVVGILIYGSFKYLEAGISVHRLQNLYFAITGEELTIKIEE